MNIQRNICTLAMIALLTIIPCIETTSALTAPSTPSFTLKYVKTPYDVAPEYTTDPYTGKTVLSQSGYHAENKSIQITIKNQAFTPYTDDDGHSINIFYYYRVKGHYAEDWEWKEIYSPYEMTTREGTRWTGQPSPTQSSGQYTILSASAGYSEGDQVDFQVQAIKGYFIEYYPYLVAAYGYYFNGTSSNWSPTQTITIKNNDIITPTPTAEPTLTAHPTLPPQDHSQTSTIATPDDIPNGLSAASFEITAIVGLVLVVVVLAVGLGVVWRRLASLKTPA